MDAKYLPLHEYDEGYDVEEVVGHLEVHEAVQVRVVLEPRRALPSHLQDDQHQPLYKTLYIHILLNGILLLTGEADCEHEVDEDDHMLALDPRGGTALGLCH